MEDEKNKHWTWWSLRNHSLWLKRFAGANFVDSRHMENILQSSSQVLDLQFCGLAICVAKVKEITAIFWHLDQVGSDWCTSIIFRREPV